MTKHLNSNESNARRADVKLILPTVLAIALFIVSIFAIIMPAFRSNVMDRKRDMIRELTRSAWSVLLEYAQAEKNGKLSRTEAQAEAISAIRYLRYGEERKDYFWITDMRPYMVMHPYRPQLEGKDLSGKDGEDPTGKKLFVEMVEVCKKNGDGYVEYMWQWKDDPKRIVPKLSYVKRFEPWNWVIGTGIYIEDVKAEIAGMTGRLISVSIVIILAVALLLFYMTRQSLLIEKRRLLAEQGLRESERKYRALVEASTQGTMMVMNGKYIYCNPPILEMLGYSVDQFKQLELAQILAVEDSDLDTGASCFNTLMNGGDAPNRFETRLKTKSGQTIDCELTVSRITLGEESGFIIIARDIGPSKQIRQELGQSVEKFKTLSNNLDIGVFRTRIDGKGKFIEANPAAVRILGFDSPDELYKINIFDLFHDKNDRLKITRELLREGSIKNRILELKRKDGSRATLSISAVAVKDESGSIRYSDGTVEDITQRKQAEESREDLIVQLQASQLFFNRPIKHFLREVPRCSMELSIRNAAALMSKNNYSAILITAAGQQTKEEESDNSHYIGIITDRDLRVRVLAEGMEPEQPVYRVMSSPLITIPDSALIFEAMLLMQEKSIRHLAVTDHSGHVVSLINDQQLQHMQQNSSAYLVKEIQEARQVDDIVNTHRRLPQLAKALIDGGANSKNICRIFTSVSDAIVDRLITFALDQLGPPPAAFAFIALGSEGREEQTLNTDQDNALIYEDIGDEEKEKTAKEYFLKLGRTVNQWLDRCGYKLCEGDIMTGNPKWCQSLSGWKRHFYGWIHAAEPQDLLEVNIFFDFRCVYGDRSVIVRLREYIDDLLNQRPAFFQFMARNALLYKPPIGFFGKIVTGTSADKPSSFDIKDAMRPIVNFARLYTLKHQIEDTNTQDRLYRLFTGNVLTKSSYEEIVKVYDYLMQMRFKHQAAAIDQNREPDNFIDPNLLTDIEHSILKNTFTQINHFQKRLSYDFTGTA